MADKLTLASFGSLQNDTSATANMNANNAAIVTAIDNTLSRDGTTHNTMLAGIDMNSNRLINLPTPISGTEPLRVLDATTLNGAGTISITGVPTAGTTGQMLVKNSNSNFDTKWGDVSSGLVAGSGIAITGSTPATIALSGTANPSIVVAGSGIAITGTTPATISLSSTPNIGTPSAGTLSNCTGLPISSGVSGMGSGVATFLANPTGSNLTNMTGGTGSGAIVLASNASIVTPTITGVTLAAGTASVDPLSYTAGTLNTTPAGGATEYDGNCFYMSPQTSGRGVVDTSQLVALSSNYNLTSSSTALQKAFNVPANGSLTVSALTYMFEAEYFIQNTVASAHQWQTGFGGTGTISSIAYSASGAFTATGAPGSAQTGYNSSASAFTVSPSSSIADITTLVVRGIVRFSVGGTFIPQVACTASLAATQTMLANSFFRIWPVGSVSVTSVGNWS